MFAVDEGPDLVRLDLIDRYVADLLVKDALTAFSGQRKNSEYGFLVNASQTRSSVDPNSFHEQVENLNGLLFGMNLLDMDIPVYVLSNGQRVVGRTSAAEMLSDIKGGGSLEKYIGVSSLKPFINKETVLERMVSFSLPEVQGLKRKVKGLPADLLIEICQGFVNALHAEHRSEATLTDRQRQMAIKAGMFVSACAKVGLDALIDEATGYQYDRAEQALEVKLRAYLADEMRKWEKTFPDQLWVEFGRLTNWKGSVTQRPKYWGKLVMELVYEYLDPDVADWLKTHAPSSPWQKYVF